jgi:hypothetical protein
VYEEKDGWKVFYKKLKTLCRSFQTKMKASVGANTTVVKQEEGAKSISAPKGQNAGGGSNLNLVDDDDAADDDEASNSKGPVKINVGVAPCLLEDDAVKREVDDLELQLKKRRVPSSDDDEDNSSDDGEDDNEGKIEWLRRNLIEVLVRLNSGTFSSVKSGVELAPELHANFHVLRKLLKQSEKRWCHKEMQLASCITQQRLQVLYYCFLFSHNTCIELVDVRRKFHGALLQIASAIYIYFPHLRTKDGLLHLLNVEVSKKALANNKAWKDLQSSSSCTPEPQQYNEMLKLVLAYEADTMSSKKAYSNSLTDFFAGLVMWLCYFFRESVVQNNCDVKAANNTVGFFSKVSYELDDKVKLTAKDTKELYFVLFMRVLLSGVFNV